VKRAILLVSVAVLMAGCGSDDEDGGDGQSDAEARTETAAPAPDSRLLRSGAIGFTFEYPEELEAEREPNTDVLAQVSVEPGERFNAIKVRRTADRELNPARYLGEFQRDFEKVVGRVERREERVGGLETGVLEFEGTEKVAGETVEFRSSSYFFTGAGRTWQIECIAEPAHREQIEDACRMALESVEFTKPQRRRARPRPKQVD
jgi:hypothetical protein